MNLGPNQLPDGIINQPFQALGINVIYEKLPTALQIKYDNIRDVAFGQVQKRVISWDEIMEFIQEVARESILNEKELNYLTLDLNSKFTRVSEMYY